MATDAEEEGYTVIKMAASIPTLKKVAYFNSFGSHDYASCQPWLIERSRGQGGSSEIEVKHLGTSASLVDDQNYYFFPRLSTYSMDLW